ncbi:MAG: GNAT family N-acetyltransferase [Eubacteriales bacterium]|nr:GNAT family N-acetyltransferase [Eubacteriales bacterium]
MVTIRPMTSGDFELFKRWLKIPHVAKWYHDPENWTTEIEQQDGAFNWIHHFIAESDNKKFGFCQYYSCADSDESWGGYALPDGAYSVDYMIGEPEHLQKGYGKKILLLLIEEISKQKDARRIIVQPEAKNTASCKTLLSCGFRYIDEYDIYVLTL